MKILREQIVSIPDKDIKIHSRCLLVRMNERNQLEDLKENVYSWHICYIQKMMHIA